MEEVALETVPLLSVLVLTGLSDKELEDVKVADGVVLDSLSEELEGTSVEPEVVPELEPEVFSAELAVVSAELDTMSDDVRIS